MTGQPGGEGPVDVTGRLDALEALVSEARSMPMSASCVVNRADVLDAVAAVRDALPVELLHARKVLGDRSAVVDEGRVQASELLERAEVERARLVSRSEVVREATVAADQLLAAAQDDVDRMRREVDDYVDAKLANFEIILHKTLSAVERGREKISGRHAELEQLASPGDDDGETSPAAPAGLR